jgi:hypothetical protein
VFPGTFSRILPTFVLRSKSRTVSSPGLKLQQPQPENRHNAFQPGHPKYGGRQRGTRNRVGGDLRLAVVAALHETGYIEKTKKGPVATGKDGVKGFIKWLALYEPKTAAALFARVLPYFVEVSEAPPVPYYGELRFRPDLAACRTGG